MVERRLFDFVQASFELAHGVTGYSASPVCHRVFRIQSLHGFEVCDCLFHLALLSPCEASVAKDIGIFRVQFEGFTVIGDLTVQIAGVMIDISPVRVGFTISGVDLDCGRIVGNRLFVIAFSGMGQASAVVRLGIAGLSCYRAVKVGNGSVIVTPVEIDAAPVQVCRYEAGIDFDGLRVIGEGPVNVALSLEGEAPACQHNRVFRADLESLDEIPDRPVKFGFVRQSYPFLKSSLASQPALSSALTGLSFHRSRRPPCACGG